MAIVDIVKYNGNADQLVWKYPSEELGTWTQLIVNESQEAILFKGGKALDVFKSGRHTLDTANIPVLNKIINLPFGGRSPFTAEIWFVNKLHSLDVKWGTATPIQIQDPKYKVFIPVRSNGMFGIQIKDSKKFLVKLVGTMPAFDKQSLVKYFRGLFITKVKDAISSYLIHEEISILEINAYIDELSTEMNERIAPVMAQYGIKLVNFYVNDISVPEDDSAVEQLKNALAKKAEMNILGYSYQQERSFDTLEGAATNTGSSSSAFMGAGMGLGMGVGLGGSVGNAFGGVAQNINTNPINETKECPKCHEKIDIEKRFCGTCGFDTMQTIKEEQQKIVCSKCGRILNGESKFCPGCGTEYNPCPKCGADLKEAAKACYVCGYELPKKCVFCGAQIAKDMKFCPECGEVQGMKCPKCGAIMESDTKFCHECGEKMR